MDWGRPLPGVVKRGLLLALAIVVLVAVGLTWRMHGAPVGWSILVVIFGGAVGATELVQRYRDAPFDVLRTGSAWRYVLVNAAAAGLAYSLIRAFDLGFGAEDAQKPLLQALVAAFGSMVFFRSSLFTMRIGDADVGVGPALFFQVLLFATDRACDRERAEPRARLVEQIMYGVSFQQAQENLPNFCFELMQNVPPAERQQFRQVVQSLSAAAAMRDGDKALNLGLMLMNVVGPEVLRIAVQTLGARIRGPASLDLRVLSELLTVDFERAVPTLIDTCFYLYGTRNSADVGAEVMREAESLRARPGYDNASRMALLGVVLQQKVGDAVLLAALQQLGPSIRDPVGRTGSAPVRPPVVAQPGGTMPPLAAQPSAPDAPAPLGTAPGAPARLESDAAKDP